MCLPTSTAAQIARGVTVLVAVHADLVHLERSNPNELQ